MFTVVRVGGTYPRPPPSALPAVIAPRPQPAPLQATVAASASHGRIQQAHAATQHTHAAVGTVLTHVPRPCWGGATLSSPAMAAPVAGAVRRRTETTPTALGTARRVEQCTSATPLVPGTARRNLTDVFAGERTLLL